MNYTIKDCVKQTDELLIDLMKANSVQEAIDIILPDVPPINDYEQAKHEFGLQIFDCQPLVYDEDAPASIAYRVNPEYINDPFSVLANWVGAVLFSIACRTYETEEGIGSLIGLQETACQFGDDEILKSAAKIAFGLGSLLIPCKENASEALYLAANMCTIPLTHKKETCVARHSFEARNYCFNFYKVLIEFAVMNNGDKKAPMDTLKREITHLYIRTYAREIDRQTDKKFKMESWVDSMVARLG